MAEKSINCIYGHNGKMGITSKYVLVNASDKTVGGPFTRYTPNCFDDVNKRSCLDLCIISKDLEKYLVNMIIDKELKFTPGYSNFSFHSMVFP